MLPTFEYKGDPTNNKPNIYLLRSERILESIYLKKFYGDYYDTLQFYYNNLINS